MKLRDVGISIVGQLYDLFQSWLPREVERLRTQVPLEYRQISEAAIRRHVVERLTDATGYRLARRVLAMQHIEPMRSSALEQRKARTAILNPMGKLTGGNFGAAY